MNYRELAIYRSCVICARTIWHDQPERLCSDCLEERPNWKDEIEGEETEREMNERWA